MLHCKLIGLHVVCAGQGAGGHEGHTHGRCHGVGRGLHTARGTAGNESRVTPLYSSSAKIDPPPGNTAVRATALNASVNLVRFYEITNLNIIHQLECCLFFFFPLDFLTLLIKKRGSVRHSPFLEW